MAYPIMTAKLTLIVRYFEAPVRVWAGLKLLWPLLRKSLGVNSPTECFFSPLLLPTFFSCICAWLAVCMQQRRELSRYDFLV